MDYMCSRVSDCNKMQLWESHREGTVSTGESCQHPGLSEVRLKPLLLRLKGDVDENHVH